MVLFEDYGSDNFSIRSDSAYHAAFVDSGICGEIDVDSMGLTAGNIAPVIPLPTLSSDETIVVDDTLTCSAVGLDADGDEVVLEYVWVTSNGEEVATGETLDIAGLLADGTLALGDSVACTVTATDGQAIDYAETDYALIGIAQ
ncbi:MAG: hypothetical protein HN348_32720 [Proteobacteria bacterium]|nr:hypothetical protein [Pseudomonadota bacterium]